MLEYNDENLIKLYSEKLSFGEIGRALGVTPSKANGRIRRMIKAGLMKHDGRVANIHPCGIQPGRTKKSSIVVPVLQPRKYTIRTRPFGYQDPTKAELRAILTQAVVNTK